MTEWNEESAQAAGFDPGRLARIDDVLAADIEAVSSRSRRPDRAQRYARILASLGYRDRETNVSMERNDLFRIASMTKPITSVAIMMLAERGQLFLPEPVAGILPQFADTPVAVESAGDSTARTERQVRPMTVHDLLRHTAGLTYGLFGASAVKTAYNKRACSTCASPMPKWSIGWPPSRLRISPAGCGTTAWPPMCSAASSRSSPVRRSSISFERRSFNRFAWRRRLLASAELNARMAQPQVNSQTGQRVALADHTIEWPWQSGGAGLYSTTSDYLKFCRMLLAQGATPAGRLLGATTVRLMTADQLPQEITYDPITPVLFEAEAPTRDMGQSFGLGFALRTHAGINPLPGSVGDYFWAGALGTYFWIDPAEQLIVIFMSQAPELRLHYRYHAADRLPGP